MAEHRGSGLVRGLKMVITFAFSHVGLCAFVAAYTVAGAFLFRELEQKHILPHHDSNTYQAALLRDLHNITERMVGEVVGGGGEGWLEALNATGWHEEVREVLEEYEKKVVEAVGNQLYDQGPDEQRERWNVIGSLFYCVTVITTIGYGNVSPKTWKGKVVTIFYAIIGIPLMLLCLTNIGNAMATSFRFMYRRVCCACCRRHQEEEDTPLTNPTNSGSAEAAEPAPYTPPPKYKPSRRNMLISPPISATIHRGSDNPLKPPMLESPSNPSSKASTPRPAGHRALQAELSLTDMEANRIVAECAAYTKTPVPGMIIPPSPEHSQNDCHDYEMLPPSTRLSPTATSRPTPEHSTPSTPLSKDAPVEWSEPKENGGPHIIIEEHFNTPPSNSSTRPGSPALTNSTHHASSMSLGVSSNVSRPWPPSTPGGLMPYVNEADEAPRPRAGDRPPRSPGKTLVVYNTLSGDALLEQSKVARRMALMNKGGFAQARTDATTVFTDPISGQAVNGDMLGLSYRPIPPDTSDADNRVPIPIVLAFVASYIGVGALLFGWLEGWSMLDAGYFCFITLSTIGFGDFVPGKSLGYETQEAQIKLVTGSMYLMFGLAVLAMSFNLVQEEVVIKCKAFAFWIGLIKE
ncbi:uncharacterized protein LOC127008962 isoform X2 [Eriocheir sinensis]|uniref:uncharacterized protein LOC127008962 isoform X2 n=1 Tax=Eriocheir sinensis TaxID=95602 RepID=UPI0021C8B05C|nr:uncharacterized protein LOC127008962 isoform X2 [Eriocheir sinensis]